jgi:isochorismate pyruvate lyase
MIEPEQCRDMSEVRAGVDALDEQIVTLLGKRMRFMDAAARIKARRDEVRDERRKAEVIAHVRSVAEQVQFPADLAATLYDQLVEASIAYEFARFDSRRLTAPVAGSE